MSQVDSMSDISIIILSKNEERYIGEVLNRVFAQKTGETFEVIVIDSGSTDSTLDIVKKYNVRLARIDPEEFGHGRTRNLGAEMGRGRILVFLNQDALPMDEFWLQNLTAGFEQFDRIAGIYSKHVPRPDCNPIRKREKLNDPTHSASTTHVKYIKDLQEYQEMDPWEKRQLMSFETVSCAIDRGVWEEYPFRDIQFAEDLEWSRRVMEAGYGIIFEPKSVVEHSHDFYCSFLETIRKHFDEGIYVSDIVGYVVEPRLAPMISFVRSFAAADVSFIIKMDHSPMYKTRWVVKSPFVRMAQVLGYMLGYHHEHIPRFFRNWLSLVNRKKMGWEVS